VFWAVYVHILFFSFKNMLPSHKEGGGAVLERKKF
jgi:hypothetical protein